MNLESGGIVAAVVIVSLLLAGLVVARRFRIVLWVAGGFCALAAVADFAELVRQVDRSGGNRARRWSRPHFKEWLQWMRPMNRDGSRPPLPTVSPAC